MERKSHERSLSPLSKDPQSIGKLVLRQSCNPEQNASPIKKIGLSIGVNTSKWIRQSEQEDNLKPITHFRMNSSVFNVRIKSRNEQSHKRIKNGSKFINSSSIMQEGKRQKSPIGTIHKQVLKVSTPKSSQTVNMNSYGTTPQLPSLKKIEKNLEGFKHFVGSNQLSSHQSSQVFTNSFPAKRKQHQSLKKKSDPEEDDKLQYPHRIFKADWNHVKLPVFNLEQTRTKSYMQQTPRQLEFSKHLSPKQNEEEIYYNDKQDQQQPLSHSLVAGFIYSRGRSSNLVNISLRTPISSLKQLLIESQPDISISFTIPEVFFVPPATDITVQELHGIMFEAFSHIDATPQIVSIKKFMNCIMMRDKKLCILWSFSGKVYFGGWEKSGMVMEGNKHGVGVQWVPARYIYFGEFKDNKKEGYGIMKKSNKEAYIGCWKNNQRNGWGLLYNQSGELTQNGQFLDGCFILPKHS